jgi:PhzF family phenazine biosynthesis protein
LVFDYTIQGNLSVQISKRANCTGCYYDLLHLLLLQFRYKIGIGRRIIMEHKQAIKPAAKSGRAAKAVGGIPLYQVDAFTSQPFHGNPAGVCLLAKPQPDAWMQAVAAEMNLSETAFLLPEANGYRLRWFTPAVEVDLCGHATLASAHILWETGRLAADQIANFYTKSGLLTACKDGSWIELNFPVKLVEQVDAPAGLAEALGVKPIFTGKNIFDYLVEVEHEDMVRTVQPNIARLKEIPARGVIVTSRSASAEYDFVSRFFAPRVGVNEDPVTGSAHCCLVPYWSEKLGKASMKAYQASARGGELRVAMDGERVRLAGQAVTIFTAELV